MMCLTYTGLYSNSYEYFQFFPMTYSLINGSMQDAVNAQQKNNAMISYLDVLLCRSLLNRRGYSDPFLAKIRYEPSSPPMKESNGRLLHNSSEKSYYNHKQSRSASIFLYRNRALRKRTTLKML
uniref:Uncharacterized protein n=1 Tax=Steinernema glaseri TaxID=37863 RepID=A0A1I7Y387_9BILA